MPIISNKYRGTKEYSIVYSELITAARYRGLITYQEIAQLMGLPLDGSHMGKETGHILGEISEDEHLHGRPMLSAIAVGVSGSPGQGFFEAAKLLGKFKTGIDDSTFWEDERKSVYNTWKRNFR